MSDQIQEGLENTDSAVNESPVGATQTVETEVNESPTVNPAWEGITSILPQEFIPQVTPILQDWDKNFQEVQLANSKYKPYEEFISHSPEDLRAAMQVAQMMNDDPRSIFDRIGEYYGYLNEEAGQGDDEEEYSEDEDQENPFDIESHPLYQQQQERLDAVQGYVEQQENERMERQADDFIKSQFAEVATLHGKPMSPEEMKILSDIALGQANSTGQPLNIVGAYSTFSTIVSNARNTSANNSAPPALGGSGNIPVTPKSYGSDSFEKNMEEKLKALGFGN